MSRTPLKSLAYIGKIPSKGDFIQSEIDNDFSALWNEWLQSIIAVSKEQLGSQWLDSYLTSPVWHFAISPGFHGEDGFCGTLIPSIDSVGRHYPFTLLANHQSNPVTLWKDQECFKMFESKVLEVLDDEFDLDDWFLSLQKTLPIIDAPTSSIKICRGIDKNKTAIVHFGTEKMNETEMLHSQYVQQFGLYSMWWTQGSDLVEPCLIVTNGLPQISQFSSMLDGKWEERNWHQIKIKKDV